MCFLTPKKPLYTTKIIWLLPALLFCISSPNSGLAITDVKTNFVNMWISSNKNLFLTMVTNPASFPQPAHKHGSHQPVMLEQVLDAIAPKEGELIVDGTLGAGGYTRAIVQKASCRIYAIDRDPGAIELAQHWLGNWPNIKILHGNFGDAETLLAAQNINKIDGIVFDLGVSSMQLDQAERGFSFRHDAPLDMRMSQEGPCAADIINEMKEEELANLIYKYGEERKSRAVAKAIVAARKHSPINRTTELADIVRSVVRSAPSKGIDPATRTFQALRIFVNNELGELERGLVAAKQLLSPGGRLVVISFHSLEDRIVKHFIRDNSGQSGSGYSRYFPESVTVAQRKAAFFKQQSGRAIVPMQEELRFNPRARSARLRVAIRTGEFFQA